MRVSLPLDEITVEEKPQVMKYFWEDLSRNTEGPPPPAWHDEVLAQRRAALEAGEDGYENWDTAKRRIRDDLSRH